MCDRFLTEMSSLIVKGRFRLRNKVVRLGPSCILAIRKLVLRCSYDMGLLFKK